MEGKSVRTFTIQIWSVFLLLGLSVDGQAQREWTNREGRTIVARLLDIDTEKKTVSLSVDTGAEFELPIGSLSLDDQAYLNTVLPKYEWTTIPPVKENDPAFLSLLGTAGIEEELGVETKRRSRRSTITLSRNDPMGYRERLLYEFSGDEPRSIAIDDRGNLLFIDLSEDPERICLVTPDGLMKEVYRNPEIPDSRLELPVINSSSRLAAWPGGGFYLEARWRTTENTSYSSGRGYFKTTLTPGGLRATPHFSPHTIPGGRPHSMPAFAKDKLISMRNGPEIGLYDLPNSSSTIPEQTISSSSEQTWDFGIYPIQVISGSQVIAVAHQDESRIVFLVNLEEKTYAPLGFMAKTSEEMEGQLNTVAVSPNGKYLVHFNRREKAFVWVDLQLEN